MQPTHHQMSLDIHDPTKKPGIILIEHDHLTLQVLNGIFALNGFQVIGAISPLAAMPYVSQSDVVLCSYDMPYIMRDIVHMLRMQAPRIKIYISSVTAVDELATDVLNHIDGYLHKPLRLQNIQALISEIQRSHTSSVHMARRGAA